MDTFYTNLVLLVYCIVAVTTGYKDRPYQWRDTFKHLVYVYKALNGLAPQYITELLQCRERHPRVCQLHGLAPQYITELLQRRERHPRLRQLHGLAPQYITELLQRCERHPRLRQLHDHLQLATPLPSKALARSSLAVAAPPL